MSVCMRYPARSTETEEEHICNIIKNRLKTA
jgi:hypothetical protein